MTEPVQFQPMEAKLVDCLPVGDGWRYEPKWDGFRCLAFRNGDDVSLISKSGKPLGRYFPEVVAMLASLKAKRFTLDGELIIPIGEVLSFAALQARLHPAASRIAKLASETPAQFMLFDCLHLDDADLTGRPLFERRAALEQFHAATDADGLLLSPGTSDLAQAEAWLAATGGALDGVIAKRLDEAYRPGKRAMEKVKLRRTADCVVGGFRYGEGTSLVASLLLGLHDADGRLNHVGFTSALGGEDRPELTRMLEAMIEPPGFTGTAPGGPSRWSNRRSAEWKPVRPELVVEVGYDQVTGDRFRHGTALLRWRPDKAPARCGMDQLRYELRPRELDELL